MKQMLILLCLALMLTPLAAEDFDLFAPQKKDDPSIYTNLRHHKLYTAYCFMPRSNERTGLGYEYFFNKKFALLAEVLYKNSIVQEGKGERLEFNTGLTYRFTRRMVGPVFFGTIGMSINNDYNNEYGDNRGLRVNQLFLKFSGQYSWQNGLGVEYGLVGKMPIETEFDDNTAHHFISFNYHF